MADLKQKQKFEESWKRLTTLTNDSTPEKSIKVEQNEVLSIFKEISEERIKNAKEKFKTKLTAILEAKLALDKTLRNGREELAKKEEKEYETLNKEMQEAYQMLDNSKKDGETLVNAAAGEFE